MVLNGIEKKEFRAVDLFVKVEKASRTEQGIRKISSFKESLIRLLRESESVDIASSGYLQDFQHEEVRIELDHSSKLKGNRTAHIAILSTGVPSSEGTIIPLTLDTNLVYGKNNDFYIDGFEHRPPAFIDFEDYKNKAFLEFKLGESADNVINERLTVG